MPDPSKKNEQTNCGYNPATLFFTTNKCELPTPKLSPIGTGTLYVFFVNLPCSNSFVISGVLTRILSAHKTTETADGSQSINAKALQIL